MKCRHCATPLQDTFLDLGFAPPSNAYVAEADIGSPERCYPLKLNVCRECWLVQVETDANITELFAPNYAYFSSTSSSWLEHASRFAQTIIPRLRLNAASFVIEVASNDGYLLRHFATGGIPCLGIEPTGSTADAAEALGIPVMREFFGHALARQFALEGKQADLIIANNVLAHVPDINDFVLGLKTALKPGGTITLEFPHLLHLIEETQFDTVYHEHFSYLSLYTVNRVLTNSGLRISDVEELSTHGGSLRVYACHAEDHRPNHDAAIDAILSAETNAGLREITTYRDFQSRADTVKTRLLNFLITQKREGRKLAGYGAAAKGNTLLNYARVNRDLLPFVCDAAPSKQGKFLPGSQIPIVSPSVLKQFKPDLLLILPWNIADEVKQQHDYIREWGGRFVIAVPEIRFL